MSKSIELEQSIKELYFQGVSGAEIAGYLNLPVTTVMQCIRQLSDDISTDAGYDDDYYGQ